MTMAKRHKRTDLRAGDEIGDPPYRVTLVRKFAADQWLVADYDRPKPQPWHMAWQFPMSKSDLLRMRGRVT